MYVKWFNSKNWGDALNPILVEYISGIKPKRLRKNKKVKETNYLVVGSILDWADKNSIVWGTGFIDKNRKLKEEPKKITAVRGPLTRNKVLEQGYSCPQIYGDPSLLFPRYYNPNIKKSYRLGIIPHYVDWKNKLIKKYRNNPNILFINIRGDIFNVVRQVLSCETIASSSLHGLIIADAYKIPSTWLEISNKIIGEGFKFKDYFLSVGRKDKEPLKITTSTKIDDIFDRTYNNKIQINLEKLYEICPFKKNNQY